MYHLEELVHLRKTNTVRDDKKKEMKEGEERTWMRKLSTRKRIRIRKRRERERKRLG